MKVLVSIDMEGIAGIATRDQVTPGAADYALGRRLMTMEANAAAAGAFAGGATTVVVNDSHGPMDNLLGEELDPRVEYVVGTPKRLCMVEQVQEGCDVALFVGYHAGPDDGSGVLSHSFAGASFSDIRLNGTTLTELEMNALVCANFGVPVGLVTGDEQICSFAEKLLPGVVTIPVKRGLGRTAALSRTPTAAREAVKEGAMQAVAAAKEFAVLVIPDELVLEADLRPAGAADYVRTIPGTVRTGARTVQATVDDPEQALHCVMSWARLTAAYAAR